ncbi:MAG: hypothetical protein CL908_11395 [Deltaproteobacteria bacterium]|nr:hypothetical protein [Deltaproteobacteria bacterium]
MTSHDPASDRASADDPFDYACPTPERRPQDPIRQDLVVAHCRAWQRLARPGTWRSGRERVAIAAEARAAAYCGFCRRRREALSPYGSEGDHDQVSSEILSAVEIDTIHRLVTDASRLTRTWYRGLAAAGLPATHYVELLSVVVELLSIDGFHRAMGIGPEPLPEPLAGEPSRKRPAGTVEGRAWVPMLPSGKLSGEEADLWDGFTGNVIRAMSLVPDAVRGLKELSSAARPLSTRQASSETSNEWCELRMARGFPSTHP